MCSSAGIISPLRSIKMGCEFRRGRDAVSGVMSRAGAEKALEQWVRAQYLLLRPWMPGGGAWATIEAEEVLFRAYLGDDAEGVERGQLFIAAARKAGMRLSPKDDPRPKAGKNRRRRTLEEKPRRRKPRNLFD